jgi:uncharacterized protein
VTIALLDVNVLVAIFDPDHVHHEASHRWFAANRASGWATCPLTENGVIRILANAAYSEAHETAASIGDRLGEFCSVDDHFFWPDSTSLCDAQRFNLARVSHRQITDIYLLGLAVENSGKFATFDRRIPMHAVIRANRESLEVIPV